MPVTGAKQINRRFRLIARNVIREVAVDLDEAADDLRRRSRELAPQLSGDLIESAKIRSRGRRDVQKRTIFYDEPYAVVRHEDFYNLGPVSSQKRTAEGPVGRKFLSRPFQRHHPRYVREIGIGIGRALRASVR